MSENSSKTLLPEGLRDVLPPDAAFENEVVERLTRTFALNGYEFVKPPLIEFEDTLLSGVGAGMGERIFRMLDPASNRTLGVRNDITTQVARIAATRLGAAPRPLRLTYAGQVLRVKGSQLEPERQFTQAGIELIGAENGTADTEVIVVIIEALKALGVSGLSVDLALPTLVPVILSGSGLPPDVQARVRAALDHKDVAEITARAGKAAALLTKLIEASGPADRALSQVATLTLPAAAKSEWASLDHVARAIRAAIPDVVITVDAVENRGFEYHTGITFSIFASGSQREVGRGGRYKLPSQEPATGATLLIDALLPVVPRQSQAKHLFVPQGTERSDVLAHQVKGWTIIAALSAGDALAEAKRMNCTHILKSGEPVALIPSN
ncbi:MAG: ATP phosphoribosyltransferase regulatory subunit [Rhodospirillaceae bacterium]|nr:ATP phosphoribosyltransferase regulatory subunit [Rhodospirillaceae bacterium]